MTNDYNPDDIELYEPELNEDLIKRQGLTAEQVIALKEVHKKLHHIKRYPDFYENPVELIKSLEYTLQLLWGFEPNADYHSHWLEIKSCCCPVDDNLDRQGAGTVVINGNCKWHGRKSNNG